MRLLAARCCALMKRTKSFLIVDMTTPQVVMLGVYQPRTRVTPDVLSYPLFVSCRMTYLLIFRVIEHEVTVELYVWVNHVAVVRKVSVIFAALIDFDSP